MLPESQDDLVGAIKPRTRPGRPRDPELEARRREQIIDVAAREFARYGFANTQVQTIANHLGVGNGTVFRYFETKEKLFLAAVECGLRELTAEMDRVLEASLDPLTMFTEAIRTYLGFFHRRPEMAELFIQERAAFPHHHRPLYFATQADDEHTCKHTEFFQRLMATGRIRPMPIERLFAVVGDLLYGTILTNLLSGRPADPESQARDVTDVILNGILADGDTGTRGHGDKGTRG
ncbi:MAG: TetR/AcrR family transcriptional regulator [Planctomycetaceae bacterium]|nr:TetR/AcrR family transcriptional regulator [Planctomycetaceae bacterium]